ncbi:hypothetical protein KY285_032262 [Solanum tuberosum]|nr:hypothetical protein KY289_032395 [Solanum tuberosum]KAH0647014.1 hypothetical protein KY285_032262 [Solanum tuberosum]
MGETNANTSALATSVVSTNTMGNYFPTPNVAHQFPVKLTSTNFLLWKTQFLPMICGCGLNHYIDDLYGDQPNLAYKVWVRQDQLVLSWIVASVSESIIPQLVGAEKTRAAWEKLVAQLHNLRRDNATIECYVQGAKSIADKLAALQHPITNDDFVEFVLAGLGPAYRPFTRSLESCHDDVTFDALYGHGSSPQSQSRHYAPTTHSGTYSGNPPPSSDFSRIFCHNCEENGHIARVCPSPRTTNGNRVSGRPSSNLASTSSQAAQNWLMDSGTTHHLTFDLDNLAIHSEYHGPEEVTLVSTTLLDNSSYTFTSQCSTQPQAPLQSHVMPTTTPSLSLEIPSNTLPNEGGNQMVDFEQFGPLSDVHRPNKLSCSSSKSHPMTTQSQTSSLKSKRPTSYLAKSTDVVEPSCYSQATKYAHWHRAMQEEYNALLKNGTWQLVPLSPSQNIIGSKWVFKTKVKPERSIDHYKARLVAKGYHQRPGLDYVDTFSPVVKPATIRLLLSLAVSTNWHITQLDISNAFLHGTLDEVVYMSQPPGFVDPDRPEHVCLLKHSFYGLKQAPRMWNKCLTDTLISYGFTSSKIDCSLFHFSCDGDKIFCLVYVDDLLVLGSSSSLVGSVITRLKSQFVVRNLGLLSYFLGIEASWTPTGLHLSQHLYATDLLRKAKMDGCNHISTHAASFSKLSSFEGSLFHDETLYRSTVGALQYLTFTRPDIAFAVNKVSQFMHSLRESHWAAVKRILRYIQSTSSHGLFFACQNTKLLHGYSDVDWGGSLDDRFQKAASSCTF